ncbi:unnamed protein product [Protopolystoma xenopodis]|uniref:Uncharacterized protein n=1 Tax=Protopolystoma xenopodis TaxID=117903 RepID=A0A3S5C2Z5_9PLAT|nr:unnamed protein product [Protopolystoma xenopodis]
MDSYGESVRAAALAAVRIIDPFCPSDRLDALWPRAAEMAVDAREPWRRPSLSVNTVRLGRDSSFGINGHCRLVGYRLRNSTPPHPLVFEFNFLNGYPIQSTQLDYIQLQ